MITYFVHSTSIDNESHVYSGWSDSILSEKGLTQALRLRDRYQQSSFDVVYSSDLSRAKETAKIAFPSAKHVIDSRLREMNYGSLNGAPTSKFPADPMHCIDNRFDKGEHCLDVESRVRSFLEELASLTGNIAVVSHKYPQLAFEVICNGCTWAEAIESDWRNSGLWQPGWKYSVKPIT